MTTDDSVIVTTLVSVERHEAFRLFTEDVDLWWRRGPRYRPTEGSAGTMRFEPGAGGRLLESYAEQGKAYEIGRILVWEPGARLIFNWRTTEFAPHEKTVVEVRFDPVKEGTRITLEHRGWDSIPKEHPFRRGLPAQAFTSMVGLRWGDLLVRFRAHTPNTN